LSLFNNLPNIGKVLEAQLITVGIKDYNDLKEIGSRQAWLKIKNMDASACLNRLYALEGAIQGIRWHDLSMEDKAALKDFYNSFSKI
jgi:DNA transformation protein and related proteins